MKQYDQDSLNKRQEKWIEFAFCFDGFIRDFIIRSICNPFFSDNILSKNRNSDEIILSLGYTSSYRQVLHFVNPVFSDNFNKEYLLIYDTEVEILDNGYRISGVQEYDDEIVTIDFSTLSIETVLIDYSHRSAYNGSPWSLIKDCFDSICNKHDTFGFDFLNVKEKALLPLCNFQPIYHLEYPIQFFTNNKAADDMFIDFAIKAGNEYIAELTKIYSNIEINEDNPYPSVRFKEKEKARNALHKEMVKPSSEVLANLILNEFKEAASQYPKAVELDLSFEKIRLIKDTVTSILRQHGYEGEYPHFKKMSTFKSKKHMACMIDCVEGNIYGSDDDMLEINFTVSTVFLKEDELHLFDSFDGHSGFFIDKNLRSIRTIAPNFTSYNDDFTLKNDLIKCTTVAAKVAECKKLTKEERSKFLTTDTKTYGCLFSVLFCLFVGIGLPLLLCPAMFLFGLIIGAPFTIFYSEAPSFLEFFKGLLFEFPWWKVFLFCFIAFSCFYSLALIFFTVTSRKRG